MKYEDLSPRDIGITRQLRFVIPMRSGIRFTRPVHDSRDKSTPAASVAMASVQDDNSTDREPIGNCQGYTTTACLEAPGSP